MVPTTSAYVSTFVDEASDLIELIESTCLDLESRPNDAELVNQLFRAFHTLKGSAGVVGLTSVSAFTHHVESAVDLVRAGKVALTASLVSVLLASKDHIGALIAGATGGPRVDVSRGNALIADLAAHTLAPHESAAVTPSAPPGTGADPTGDEVDYLISFTPNVAPHELGVAPADLLDGLNALGRCTVIVGPDAEPDGDDPYATWELLLSSSAGVNAIKDVFIFVETSGTLSIDQGLTQFGDDSVVQSLEASSPSESDARGTSVAAGASVATDERRAPTDANVRVSSDRLDRLVKLIGELVTTQSRLQSALIRDPDPEFAAPIEAMDRLVGDLRDQVLALRMVPIGATFKRFQRLVRDVSQELGKDIELVTHGDETELDKTVTDQLGEALVHVLRNSMDHGLEQPDARVAAGKSPRGTLRLSAAQEGSNILISIEDDGRGVDLAAVRRKAESQGLIRPGDALSEAETVALIMRPGFSTAAAVTQLSGRGVGMDAVKRTVEGLRGSMSVSTRPGLGTKIVLTLPLTLAIVEGLLVEIQGNRFVVPLSSVVENLELTYVERRAMGGRHVVPIRGELVPYIRLRDCFGMAGEPPRIERIVVVSCDGERVGLVVDRIVGSHQAVIQPLGRFYRNIGYFSGSTILGDGRVAMILDIAGAVRTGSATPSTHLSQSVETHWGKAA